MSKPTIQKARPANQYAGPSEVIAEFFDRETQKGGLISIARKDSGELVVSVYRTDPGVIVIAAQSRADA